MAFWQKLRDALRSPTPAPLAPDSPAPARPTPDRPAPEPATATRPASSGALPAAELHLRSILDRLAAAGGNPAATRAAMREPAFDAAFDKLIAGERTRTATELMRRFLHVVPEEHRLAARLVELLCERLAYDTAIPYLEALLASPAHAARAHFLLAEAADRRGDSDAARLHYELLLALDLDYPKALARWTRLRPERVVNAAAPTVAGVDGEQTRVGDRFRLRRELGRGNSGTVYLALDEELDREVALKLLHPQRSASARGRAEARLRAWNEARIAAALRHPGVVAIYDLDEERGLIAMELARGGTLRDRLAHGALPPREALRHAAELFATLEAVHRAGIIHRDLKPGNVLFRPAALSGSGDHLLLGDFGLAHLEQAEESAAPAGSLPYLAPEARRGAAEAASDTYAAGLILFEMLTGTPAQDRTAMLSPNAASPTIKLPPTIPLHGPLTQLIQSLLSPAPEDRPTPEAARSSLIALLSQLTTQSG